MLIGIVFSKNRSPDYKITKKPIIKKTNYTQKSVEARNTFELLSAFYIYSFIPICGQTILLAIEQ